MKKILSISLAVCFSLPVFAQIPVKTLVQISKAEDELRFDKTLEDLMNSKDAQIRKRAALASGRIGKDAAISALTQVLVSDSQTEVRTAAMFAIGEIESAKGANAVLQVLKNPKESSSLRAHALEAAGKIAAAIVAADKKIAEELGTAILTALDDEGAKQQPDKQVILLGITAILRAKPDNGEFIAAKFLTNADARIRADAANTLSRLKAKNANEQLRAILFNDKDAIARANAARALGAAEDAGAFDLLLGTALNDEDSRVRVSAIRSLGSLKDAKAADKLLERAEMLLAAYKKSKFANPVEKNELLEIATTLGRILPNSNNEKAVRFLNDLYRSDKYHSLEISIGLAKVSPAGFANSIQFIGDAATSDWQVLSTMVQGFAEFANLNDTAGINKQIKQESIYSLHQVLDKELKRQTIKNPSKIVNAIPEVLRAYAAFKPNDLPQLLREHLKHKDAIVRATAAELLGEQQQSKENIEALKIAFAESLKTDKFYNDAQLAIISALVKLDKPQSFESLRLALRAPDYLVRRRAADLVKQNDLTKDFRTVEAAFLTLKPYDAKTSTKLGQILNTNADYVRAVSRKSARAILKTEKGTFTIEFSPADAPLTVDNFIKLARAKYFDGLTIHRVVPNFVVQDGDPRGDGNGGPGWEIRDEINTIPYERGAVGMALSGKDTGGSQWFVIHSPQPHLDGGYTVFGRVNETDMKIVDNLVRGDKILSVKIVEGNSPQKSAGRKPAR